MGATLSNLSAGNPGISLTHCWLLEFADSKIKYAGGSSLEAFVVDDAKYLAFAYQASESPHECSIGQHIRFALSKDGGDTWTPNRVIVWGLSPIWSPVLFYHSPSSRLFMFYSESRKACSPGGDIKMISSTDLGVTWTPPTTIYTHEADGETPKMIASKPAIDGNGTWHLAFHSEPPESYKTFNQTTWCPLKEAAEALPQLAVPPTAAPQGVTTTAGVLRSTDMGTSWTVAGFIEDPRTWLIEPALEWSAAKNSLLALFRTGAGRIFSSRSTDSGSTWTKPSATTLPNPNSKFSTITIDGQILMAYNPSAKDRSSLALALSVDDGRSWEVLTTIDGGSVGGVGGVGDPALNFTSPSIAQWSDDTMKIAYTVWGRGVKLATVKLPTVES